MKNKKFIKLETFSKSIIVTRFIFVKLYVIKGNLVKLSKKKIK